MAVEDVAVLVLDLGPGGKARDDLSQVGVLGNAVPEFAASKASDK